MEADTRSGVGLATFASTACAVCMIAQQVAAKAVRDTLFLEAYGAERLPLAMGGAATLSIAVAVGWGRLLARTGPARLVPGLFVVHGVAFALEWALLQRSPGIIAVVLYLHTTVLGGVVISGFWSVLNERFDPHRAKTAMWRATAGAALGGVLGGTGLHLWSGHGSLGDVLLALGALNLLGALCLRVVSRGAGAPVPAPAGARSAEPYVRRLALLVVLTSALSALSDWTFKSHAAATYTEPSELMSFLALFYTVTSVLAFSLSAGASRAVLAALGLVGTMALLPALMGVAAALSLATGALWALLLLSGTEETLSASLYRAGYEALYTPLPERTKRASKVWLDVGFKRLGTAAASGLQWLSVAALGAVWAQHTALVVCLVLSAVVLWVMRQVNQGYVASLVASLRAGTVTLSEKDALDATTRRTLVDTTQTLDRQRLLREISAYRERQEAPSRPPAPDHAPTGQPLREGPRRMLQELASGDPERAERALARRPLERHAVPLVIDWVDDVRLGPAAQRALRSAGRRIVGQLSDALLDEDIPVIRRAWLTRCFHERFGQGAIDGLLAALHSEHFAVRHGAALGLDALSQKGLRVMDSAPVLDAAVRELSVGDSAWEGHSLPPVLAETRGAELGLAHVFTLLGLAYDRAAVHACRLALNEGSQRVRGTSLEYLDAVLPTRVRNALWPRLHAQPVARAGRDPKQLVEELVQSTKRPDP